MVLDKKKFGGKVYRLVHHNIAGKENAKKAADRHRGGAFLVRVVKRRIVPPDGGDGWAIRYDIYARAK